MRREGERAARGGDWAAAGSAGRAAGEGEQWQEAGAGPVLICRPARSCAHPPPDLTPHRSSLPVLHWRASGMDGARIRAVALLAVARGRSPGLFSRSLLAKLMRLTLFPFSLLFLFPSNLFPPCFLFLFFS